MAVVRAIGSQRTGRKALPQLVDLARVLEDEGVQVALAADLELDLLVGVLLHAHSCKTRSISQMFTTALPILQSKSFVHACISEIRKTSIST